MSEKGALDETSVAIGRLLGGIETLTRAMSEDSLATAQYRTDMRREMKERSATLHELVGELKAFKTDRANMRSDLDETKKDVAEQRDARLRAQGAAGLAGRDHARDRPDPHRRRPRFRRIWWRGSRPHGCLLHRIRISGETTRRVP
jgi:hypothetical protein